MPDVDLSLVSVDDLIEELNKRYDAWIFCGHQIREPSEQKIFTTRKWRGGSAVCAGLASQIQIAIYDTFMENMNDIDDISES